MTNLHTILEMKSEGLSTSEIARRVGMPRTTVRDLLKRNKVEMVDTNAAVDYNIDGKSVAITSWYQEHPICDDTLEWVAKEHDLVIVIPISQHIPSAVRLSSSESIKWPDNVVLHTSDGSIKGLNMRLDKSRVKTMYVQNPHSHSLVAHYSFQVVTGYVAVGSAPCLAITTGCINDLSFNEFLASNSKTSSHSKGALSLRHWNDKEYLMQLEAPLTKVTNYVVGDVHLPMSDLHFLEQVPEDCSVWLHDLIEFGPFSHHNLDASTNVLAKDNTESVAQFWAKMELDVATVGSSLRKRKCTPLIVQSNHDTHWITGLMNANPKQLAAEMRKIYFLVGHLMFGKKLDLATFIYNVMTLEYPDYDFTMAPVVRPTDKLRFILGNHGHRMVNGRPADVCKLTRSGVRSIVGHFHYPSRFGPNGRAGTNSWEDLHYNTVGLTGWAKADIIVWEDDEQEYFTHIIPASYFKE